MNDNISYYKSKIESLSDDIELMAHIASHDIKDPLRQALSDLEENQDIHSAKESITKVIEIITLLREYSHLLKFNETLSKVDCNEVLSESLDELSAYIKEHKATITNDKLPEVNAFKPHLKIVFLSLIKNSVCYNDNNEPKLHISCKKEGQFWLFKFSDNGIGIEHFYRKYVFALFQKLDEEHGNTGYGAGLAFCKKIIENHNGKIWFESDGSSGTDFYFTIPL
ncbi:MAG: ATP-binding protein [Rickettsiales bacterium]|nr:ATP-binding protein [Pseudomonadota bacterium]MDA0967434.1 ATP-binding protein [Pseudomonadota bacterium]MDG4544198.1 ATP-binding protein [Rickettsiales bacterium]MDG4546379.1 ATP-binding protein [Rickettsiales bacterium]MDG4548522.1 ATP-binding protein [Rickettsiales bacterium]